MSNFHDDRRFSPGRRRDDMIVNYRYHGTLVGIVRIIATTLIIILAIFGLMPVNRIMTLGEVFKEDFLERFSTSTSCLASEVTPPKSPDVSGEL